MKCQDHVSVLFGQPIPFGNVEEEPLADVQILDEHVQNQSKRIILMIFLFFYIRIYNLIY